MFERWSLIAGTVAGAAAMFLVWTVYQPFHDASVAREARKAYVAISDIEAARAKARVTEQLLAAQKARADELERVRVAYAGALSNAQSLLDAAAAANEGLQNEIDELEAARPTGVPRVRDLGVKLRN